MQYHIVHLLTTIFILSDILDKSLSEDKIEIVSMYGKTNSGELTNSTVLLSSVGDHVTLVCRLNKPGDISYRNNIDGLTQLDPSFSIEESLNEVIFSLPDVNCSYSGCHYCSAKEDEYSTSDERKIEIRVACKPILINSNDVTETQENETSLYLWLYVVAYPDIEYVKFVSSGFEVPNEVILDYVSMDSENMSRTGYDPPTCSHYQLSYYLRKTSLQQYSSVNVQIGNSEGYLDYVIQTYSTSTIGTSIPTPALRNTTVNYSVPNCQSETKRGDFKIQFSETKPGYESNATCPYEVHTGYAVRKCTVEGEWGDVNLVNCVNRDIKSVTYLTHNSSVLNTAEKITNVSEKLIEALNFVRTPLVAGDIKTVIDILIDLSNAVDMNNITVEGRTIENVAKSVDKILNSEDVVWKSIAQVDNYMDAASRLLLSMENITSTAIKAVNFTAIKMATDNLLIEIQKSTLQEIRFPPEDRQNETDNTIVYVQETETELKYSTIIYKNVKEKFSVNSFWNDKDKSDTTSDTTDKSFNSDIVSFSIEPKPDAETLKKNPLKITFKIQNNTVKHQICAYLVEISHQSSVSYWSSEGCDTQIRTDEVVCSCYHLSNFAVLMSRYEVTGLHKHLLQFISKVGITISLISLAVTIAVYGIMWRYVKSDRSILHVHLSCSLFLGYTIFLAGIESTGNSITCSIVSGLLHFLFLFVFFVMLAQGILILKSVTSISSTSILKYLLVLIYVAPLLIVVTSVAVTRGQGYGYEKSCWFKPHDPLLWAFAGPAFFILLVNAVILLIVLRIMQTSHAMMDKSLKKKTKSVLRSVCILCPILGLTWAFGILSVSVEGVVFQYLFTLTNSLQGLLIFVLQCVLQYQVRDGLRAIIRRYRSTSFESSSKFASSSQDKANSESLIKPLTCTKDGVSESMKESTVTEQTKM